MPAWATVVLTLGSAVIGGAIALIAVERQNRHATLEREAIARAQRQEAAGRVLGRIRAVLVDLEPTRVTFNLNPQSGEQLDAVNRRWLEQRDELASFGAGSGSGEIDDVSTALAVEIANLINRLGWIVGEYQQGQGLGSPDLIDDAKEHYTAAQRLTRDLLELVQKR